MTPNEVRIDNYIQSYLTKELVKVDWLVIKHLWDGNIQSIYDPKPVYEPILLTPQILENCGFERTNPISDLPTYTDYRKGGMVINYHKDWDRLYVEYCSVDIEERTIICEIKYLHQLQNLYWCLALEELNYQP